MPAHIHHGPPGSFKSFGVIMDEVVPALKLGRTVVSNIRGLDSIEQIESALDMEIPDGTDLINVPHNADGDELMRRFFHWVPHKALIVIDELQRIYPKKQRNLDVFAYPDGQKAAEAANRPFSVENAFDQHRHFGWDIFSTTPNIAKVHMEVREVCDYAFRHKDITGIVPWIKSGWKEQQHAADNSGTSQSHHLAAPKQRKPDKRYFDIYSSTAIDSAEKQINKNPNLLKQPKFIAIFGCLAIAVGFGLYSAYRFNTKTGDFVETDALAAEEGNPTNNLYPSLPDPEPRNTVGDGEPYASYLMDLAYSGELFVVGVFVDYLVFEHPQGSITHSDLIREGIEVNRKSSCFILLTYLDESLPVHCPDRPDPSPQPISLDSSQTFANTF